MKTKKHFFSLILIIVGAFAVLFAAGALIYAELSQSNMREDAIVAVEKIKASIPEIVERVPEERGNNMMPSLEVDGNNYVALLEVPQHKFELPVVSSWKLGDVEAAPCRYTGSIYDKTLIIGSSDEEGQMSFVEDMEIDDVIYLTDMSGGKYEYKVTAIQHSDKATDEKLKNGEFDLTIFVRSSGESKYLLVRCTVSF